jgi:hypothetical protein
MVHIKGLTQLSNLYVSETEVTAKVLALTELHIFKRQVKDLAPISGSP